MKNKSIYFILLLGLSYIVMSINSDLKPKELEDYHFTKLDGKSKEVSAWSGPWKCVKDTRTSLIWEVKSYAEDLRDKECSYSWFNGKTGEKKRGTCYTADGNSNTQDIIEYANSSKLCGYENWRLPTAKELKTLLFENPRAGNPYIEVEYFPYTKKNFYWTSDIDSSNENVVAVSFYNKKVRALRYNNVAFVRLVRSQ